MLALPVLHLQGAVAAGAASAAEASFPLGGVEDPLVGGLGDQGEDQGYGLGRAVVRPGFPCALRGASGK